MKEFGIWILLTFAIYWVIAIAIGNKHTMGSLTLGAILALGAVLAFF